MSGQVSTQPGGVNDWIAATQNRPLTSADRVWTDKNSKAELNVGDGFLRMNSETSVTLTNVTDNNVQIELDQGTLEVTVKHLEKGEIYEVDTPNYAFTVMKSGVYRFDVYPNEDQSWVTVRSGYGEATGKGAAVRVNSGKQMRFSGSNFAGTHRDECSFARRLRRLGPGPRQAAGRFTLGALRFAGRDRLSGPRRLWPLGADADLRQCLDSEHRAGRLGSLSLRTLGVDHSLGMDLG